ncbi:MAG: fucose isomerase, partial [Planctomycetales bacterium]|nr:fucose isomerase [Planctomycetales bacterium]
MTAYATPPVPSRPQLAAKHVYLVANGDLRLSANQNCWAAQHAMEQAIAEAVTAAGWTVVRAHPYKEDEQHGFIGSQKEGVAVFRALDPEAPLIVAEAVWQYSHHLLPGLSTHRGPLLTLANWSGTWPGLVGMLNLNGSLTKAGVPYCSLWADDFADPAFREKLAGWLNTSQVQHDLSHVKPLSDVPVGDAERDLARSLAAELRQQKAIMGVFDEGCMGMFNAIIPDHLLHPTGCFKERLSQSTLFAAMQNVSDADAVAVYAWLKRKGLQMKLGTDEATELTEPQILLQCKIYVAAVRLADEFGCDAIGIQYQQGLKDLTPASDLVEGMLNNADRPPVRSADGKRVLFEGEALPHFNEVDECAGLDGLVTYRLWRELGFAPENTLHDLRWGARFGKDYVWVLLISGAAPPAHFIGGWKGASSERQPSMYFRLGGGTMKGISKPGHIVWSRVFVMNGALHCDIGVAEVVKLPDAETNRRWQETTPQWPIMH